MKEFPSEVIQELKNYVYLYIDPDTKEIFYIGRGQGNRAFQHFSDQSETEKVKRIHKILESGKEPIIEILRYGLEKNEAKRIESAAIDLIGKRKLTNIVKGYQAGEFGRTTLEEIMDQFTAPEAEITERGVLIFINKLYQYGMTSDDLYEVARGIWVIGKRREKADYAFVIYRRIIKEIFKIQYWVPAGTTEYRWRTFTKEEKEGRYEFVGSVADEFIREKYIGKSVRNLVQKRNQNPINYVNVPHL